MSDPQFLLRAVAEQCAEALVDTLDAIRRLNTPDAGLDELFRQADVLSDNIADWRHKLSD